jgi:hypothetical protein
MKEEENMEQQCISVDKDKALRVMELGWNLSALCRVAIDEALSGDNEDLLYAIRLHRVEDEITLLKLKIYEMTGILEASQKRIEYLQGHRAEMEADWEKTKYTVRLTKLVTTLNNISFAAEYNMVIIEEIGREVIQKIKELNPSFDTVRQVQRFKMLMQEP